MWLWNFQTIVSHEWNSNFKPAPKLCIPNENRIISLIGLIQFWVLNESKKQYRQREDKSAKQQDVEFLLKHAKFSKYILLYEVAMILPYKYKHDHIPAYLDNDSYSKSLHKTNKSIITQRGQYVPRNYRPWSVTLQGNLSRSSANLETNKNQFNLNLRLFVSHLMIL